MALIGYALQCGLLNRTLGDDLLPPLLVTFGLSVIIQNGLLELFTADSRRLQAGAIEVDSIRLGAGLAVGTLPLIQFALAVAVIAGLQWLFYRTAIGRAFRATSDDQDVAQLVGLDNRHVFALAMALSLAVVAIAGVLLAIRTNFDPSIGPARLIFGFEAVIMGGLGSMWGTLVGGIILGRGAGDRRPDRSRLAGAGRTCCVPDRAGGAAARPVSEGAGMSTFQVEHATRSSRIGLTIFAVLIVVLLAAAPWWGERQTCGCSPRSIPSSRWRACGTCLPATPGSCRSASRPMSGSAPTCCSQRPCWPASIRWSPFRSPASSAPSSHCRSPA